MTVAPSKLASYVGASEGEQGDMIAGCLAEAQALVERYNRKSDGAGGFTASDAPEVIVDRAVLEVAADLWNRRNAPNGIVNAQFENFGGDQGAAVRIARDPMQAAYKILGRWVSPW